MKKLKLGPYIDEVVKDLTNANIIEDDIHKLIDLSSAIINDLNKNLLNHLKMEYWMFFDLNWI